MSVESHQGGADPERRQDERGVASAIYGLIVCSSTLAAAGASGREYVVAISVLVTVFVYWAAESYAHALARHAVVQKPLGWADVKAILDQGWPMVSVTFLPLATLLLMARLAVPFVVAVNVSLAVATVLLMGAGWTASRASGLHGWRLAASTATSALFGLAMIFLKNFLH